MKKLNEKEFDEKIERYPDSKMTQSGTIWQSVTIIPFWITMGRGANLMNPHPKTELFWWVMWVQEDESNIKFKEVFNQDRGKIFALKLNNKLNSR